MSSRRAFLIGVAFLVAPLEAGAQPRAVPRVGVLAQDIQPGLLEAFRDELQRLGTWRARASASMYGMLKVEAIVFRH